MARLRWLASSSKPNSGRFSLDAKGNQIFPHGAMSVRGGSVAEATEVLWWSRAQAAIQHQERFLAPLTRTSPAWRRPPEISSWGVSKSWGATVAVGAWL